MKRRLAALLGCITLVGLVSACSPFYVMRAAYEQGRILWRREPIDRAIARGDVSDDERHKLELVLEARAFAAGIGLTPHESFTRYSKVDRDVLVWVLVASRADAFDLKKWWFPIVGSVPYKGFFAKHDAEDAGRSLAGKGYEVSIRGAEAFSTLGWFNDPVLSTTLRHADARIANTVIHEITHATVWVGSQVDFNESFANFVGTAAAAEFFAARALECGGRSDCAVEREQQRAAAEREATQTRKLAGVIMRLFTALNDLYRSPASTEEKLARRKVIFEEIAGPSRQDFPALRALQELNNAEIIQYKLYFTGFDTFAALFECRHGHWSEFIEDMKQIALEIRRHGGDAFPLLQQRVDSCRGGTPLPPAGTPR